MKKENSKTAQIIKSTGIGIGAIIMSLSFFMYASQPATASNESSFNFEDDASIEQLRNLPVTSGGKYQMTMQVINDAEDNLHWYTLVWDTETGRSKLYYANHDRGMNAAHSSYDLPSSPL